ncbi:MAG: hypothetical protein A2269_08765 [Lentisphaerae bacterium RIFOXYA12_FULL_60_10]|nr:MAG: hypothetical protein A2269_08765 [Lentisphaerae bacterium RIFOXYA12_FULL_60_10]
MSDIEKIKRFSFGCMGVLMLLMMAPYLYMEVRNRVDERTASRPPKTGTPREVQYLLNQNRADDAFAACLRNMPTAQDDETKRNFANALDRCIQEIYRKQKETRGKDQVDSIHRELSAKLPEPNKVLQDLWLHDRSAMAREAIHKKQWVEAGQQLEMLRTALGNATNETLARLYRDYASPQWQDGLYHGRVSTAAEFMQGLMAVPGYGRSKVLREEYRRFLEAWLAQCHSVGDTVNGDPVLDQLLAFYREAGEGFPFSRFDSYIVGRLDRCVTQGDDDWPKAFFKTLVTITPRDRLQFQNLAREYQEKRWKAVAAKGDFARVQVLLVEFSGQADLLGNDWCLQQYAASLLAAWEYERKAGRISTARQCLEQVLVHYANGADFHQLANALRQEWPVNELLNRVDSLLDKGLITAARSVVAAVRPAGLRSASPTETDHSINLALLACARAGATAWLKQPDKALLDNVQDDYRNLVLFNPVFRTRRDVWHETGAEYTRFLIRVAQGYAANQSFREANDVLDAVQRNVATVLWEDTVRQAGVDPWQGVPPEILETVRTRVTGNDAAQRLVVLTELARQGAYVVPQAVEIAAVRRQVGEAQASSQAMLALTELEAATCRDQTLAALRTVLRQYPAAPAATEVKNRLQGIIRKASTDQENRSDREIGKASGFTLLSEVLGFYVDEIGVKDAHEPFAIELKKRLKAAANASGKLAPMTRVFFLSLLADSMPPDDPEGRKAHQQAMEQGLKLMDQMAGAELVDPGSVMPSLLENLSVMAIENKTPYHLMVFAKGPEQFFVRLSPYRRGSAVLKNGMYDLAVIAAREDIQPFRGKRKYDGEYQLSSYIVKMSQGGTVWDEAAYATGDFRLLRMPQDVKGYTVHPKSGMVLPGGK